jgi:hypothetical protein
LAVRTNDRSGVASGKLLKKNLVGSASPCGHSAINQQAPRGSFPADNLWAGRTRQAANRDDIFPLLPSRQVTLRKSRARLLAHSSTAAEIAPARTFSGRDGGRPRPLYGGTSPRSASAAMTINVLPTPTQ